MLYKIVFIFLLATMFSPSQNAKSEDLVIGDLRAPTGFAFAGDGALYVSEWGANRVSRIQDGKKSTALEGIPSPAGLAFDRKGNLYVAGYGDGNIYSWNGKDKPRILASGFVSPCGLFFEENGALLVANRNAGEIARVFPNGKKEIVSAGHNTPVGIARTADGDLFVSCYGGSVDLLSPEGERRSFSSGLVTPGVGIIPADAQSVFVVDYGTGKIAKVDSSGKVEEIASGLRSPVALARTPDGNLLAGCWNDGSARKIILEARE